MNKTMSIKLDEDLFENVKKIELEEKNNAFILKLSDVPLCDDDEEKELVNILNTLTEEDLKIAKKEIIKL